MRQLHKRERLEATLQGSPVDRPAVSLWRHWPVDDQFADVFARSTLDFQRCFDWDFIKVMPEVDYLVEDWGVESRWTGVNIDGARDWAGSGVRDPGGRRDWGRKVIQRPEDWTRLQVIDPYKGRRRMILEALRIIGAEVREDVPFIVTIFNPLVQAWLMAGEERLWGHLRQYPRELKMGLDTIARSNEILLDAAKATGIAGVFYSLHHATYTLLSEAEYREFGRPYDLRLLSSAKDLWFNMLHLHENNIMFDLVKDYPVQAINWHDLDTSPSLKEALQIFPGSVVGGVSFNRTMLVGAPDQVRAEVKAAVAQTNGKRHIVAGGCCVPITTPWGNIRALRQAVEDAR